MFTWIILFICGVPVVVAINQALKQRKSHDAQLKKVQNQIARKSQQEIDKRVQALKEKRNAKERIE